MELGARDTADDCILDHDDVIISIDERKLLLVTDDGTNYPYKECYDNMRINMTAAFCMQKYES